MINFNWTYDSNNDKNLIKLAEVTNTYQPGKDLIKLTEVKNDYQSGYVRISAKYMNETIHLQHVKKYDNFIIIFFLNLLGFARNINVNGKNYCFSVKSLEESLSRITDLILPILYATSDLDTNSALSQSEQEKVDRIFNKPEWEDGESQYILKLLKLNKLDISQLTPHINKLNTKDPRINF